MGRVKQLKPFVKIYVGLILTFFVSMALVFCIPDSWIQDNVNSSIEIMDGEGSYPMYFFYRHNSIMDVHTEEVRENGLISNRDYREGFDVETALDIMIDEVKNFDMKVFLAFQRVAFSDGVMETVMEKGNLDELFEEEQE